MNTMLSLPDTAAILFMGKPLLCANDHEIDRNRRYIVKDLLLAGQVSMLCGAPNLGKSAVSAAAMSHIAMGRDFAGKRVQRAAVLYVAAEDPKGIADRAYPYMSAGRATASPFHIHETPINLCSTDEVNVFIDNALRYLVATGCENLIIVIDTLNLCIGDGDENSARDMGKAVGNAQRIATETGAHVMIIHHMGGHDGSRPRGSTAMEGNVDTLLTMHRADEQQPEGVVFIAQKKQRSIARGAPIAFRIQAFDAGIDSEGDHLTLPMAVPFAAKSSLVPVSRRKAPQAGPNVARISDVRRVIETLSRAKPDQWFEAKTIGAQTGTPFNDVRDNADSLRKGVKRALDFLAKAGEIESNAIGHFRIANTDVIDDEQTTTRLH